jgi:hypothetical protein
MAKSLSDKLELSPLALRGLAVLGIIALIFVFDRVSSANAALSAERETLRSELAQLRAIESSDDPDQLVERARVRQSDFEKGFLRAETIGLNEAQFESELISILGRCEAEQVVVDMENRPAEDLAGLVVLEANLRMRGSLLVMARCLNGLDSNEVAMDVDSLRWLSSQQLLLRVRAHALVQPGEAS